MSKMNTPEMKVVRFKETDVIVASVSLGLTGFSGTTAADGKVTYNGTVYEINSKDAVSDFLSVLRGDGITNAGISTGGRGQSLKGTLNYEATSGANGWNGTYVYDPNATWNNGSTDLHGVFKRQ